MTLLDIYNIAKENSGISLIIFMCLLKLIDVSKIPLNPWKWIAKCVRNLTIGDMPDKLGKIEKKLDTHIIQDNRSEITAFASALSEGKKNFTKEYFQQKIALCDSYTKYCEENKIENGVAEQSIKFINDKYQEKLQTNGFLQGYYLLTPTEQESD